jgi:cysteine desulfurase
VERIERVPVDREGRLSLAALEQAVAARGLNPGQVTVAVQIANNETGVINPPGFFEAVKAKGWFVLADAVQAAGKIDLAPFVPHLDALFISAHKIGGPKGVGALVTAANACGAVRPLIVGGGQEKGMRGGTENVSGIIGLGAAATYARANLAAAMAHMAALRDRFEERLLSLARDAVIFGQGAERLPNTSLFAIPGLAAQTALIAFDLDGVAVSSGSACASGKVGQSHVLAAMGIDPALGRCALRVSFGDRSDAADVAKIFHSLERQFSRLEGRRPAA